MSACAARSCPTTHPTHSALPPCCCCSPVIQLLPSDHLSLLPLPPTMHTAASAAGKLESVATGGRAMLLAGLGGRSGSAGGFDAGSASSSGGDGSIGSPSASSASSQDGSGGRCVV